MGKRLDFSDILGQEHCKRGLEVALAGGHGVLLIGPPNPDIKKLTEAAHAINRLLPVYSATPCPCGNFTHPKKECYCSPKNIQTHLGKIAENVPLDRIGVHIEVPVLNAEHLTEKRRGEPSQAITDRLLAIAGTPTPSGSDKEADELLKLAILELGISVAAYDKICAVAGTIARMDGKSVIAAHHVSEAISYRSLDRNLY